MAEGYYIDNFDKELYESEKLKKQLIRELLNVEENKCLDSFIAAKCGVESWQLTEIKKHDPAFGKEYDRLKSEMEQDIVDKVENQAIDDALETGNFKQQEFYLKNKGKKRGYGDSDEGVEVTNIISFGDLPDDEEEDNPNLGG
jgi:hypothetical protein